MKMLSRKSLLVTSLFAISTSVSAGSFDNIEWTLENSYNIAENDSSGCALEPEISTSSSESFTFGLTDDSDCNDGTQRDEFKYERRSGYNRIIAYFTIDGTYPDFNKMGIAQTHDDSTGDTGVFSIYQVREEDGAYIFGVQGDSNEDDNGWDDYDQVEISLDTTYKLVIKTNGLSDGDSYEDANLYLDDVKVWSSSIEIGGEEEQYKKIGAYQLTGGEGEFHLTWESVKLYTGE